MNVTESLENYLELFNEIKSRVDDDATARVILAELGKDRRSEMINKSKVQKPMSNDQKRLMDELEINYPETLSMREASDLISDKINEMNDKRNVKVLN